MILDALDGLEGKARAAEVTRLVASWGISKQAISAWARKAGQRVTAVRRDRGRSKVAQETVKVIASDLLIAKRSDGRLPLHTSTAIARLRECGAIDTDAAYSTICRELRRHDLSKRDLRRSTPYRSRATAHPNAEWQIDASNCLQYYFTAETGLGERDIAMQLHKNHPAEVRKITRELIRYVIVDHYSGAFVFDYVYAAGERALDFLRLLTDVWQPPARWNHWRSAHPAFQFHGVPARILADQGAFGKAAMAREFLDRCGVELMTHLPGNPRAKGSVEGHMPYIEQFESGLKSHPPRDLQELRRWAWEWAVRINCTEPLQRKGDRSGRTRLQRWLPITREQLRVPTLDQTGLMGMLRTGRQPRTVGMNGRLFYQHFTYRVPDTNTWGRTVDVAYNPITYPEIDVTWRDQEDGHVLAIWRLQPLQVNAGGFLSDCAQPGEVRRPAATATQRALPELERIASERSAVTWKGTGDKRIAMAGALNAPRTPIYGRDLQRADGVATLPKAGTPAESRDPAAERRLTVMGLLGELADALGRPLTRDENARIRAAWPEGCRTSEIDAIADGLHGGRREGHDARQTGVG